MTDIRHRMEIEGSAAKDLEEISKAAASVDDELTDISKTAPAMGKALKVGAAAGLAAVVALAAGVAAAGKATLKLAGDLNTLAKRGRGVRALASEIDTLDKAFGLLTKSGVDSARVLEDLNLNLGKAAGGSVEAQEAFDALELPEDFASQGAVDRVRLVVDALTGIEDPALRAETASLTLGRSWRSMLAVFESGEGALDTAIGQVRESGVVSDEAARQSEQLIDAVDLATQAWDSLAREGLQPLIPVLTDVATALGDVIRAAGDTQVIREWIPILADIAAGAIKATAKLFGLSESYASLGEQSRISRRLGDVRVELDKLQEARERRRNSFLGGIDQAKEETEFIRERAALHRKEIKLQGELEAAIKKTAAASRERSAAGAGGGGGRRAPRAATGGAPAGGGGGAAAAGGGGGGGFGTLFDLAAEAFGTADLASLSFEELGQRIRELAPALEEAQSEFESFQDSWSSGVGSMVNAIAGLATFVFDELAASQGRLLDESVAAARESAKEIAGIERKLSDSINDEEKRKLLAQKKRLTERAEAEKEAALQAFNTQKALAIVSASINTALAIINAFATAPTIIVGAALAVVAGAAGAVSIAKIASQSPPEFARGGVLREGDIPMAGGQVGVRMEPGEGVLTRQGLRNAGGPGALEDLNAGRMGGGLPPVIVMKVGARTTEAIATEQLRSRGGRMSTALRTARPLVGRRVAGR